MNLKEEIKRPGNYALAGAALLLGLAMCDKEPEKAPTSVAEPVVLKHERRVERPREATNGSVQEVLEGLISEEGPTVVFNEKDFIYKWEQGLADCIQMQDNTCYLKHDYTAMFRTRLECTSDSWDEFAQPLSFAATFNLGVGATINMQTPSGELVPYEGAPSPELDLEKSQEFYTKLCRDALELLDTSAYVNPCEENPDSHTCVEAELNAEWAISLEDSFAENYDLLAENGIFLEDAGMNVLRVEFETAEGATERTSFFPKKTFCFEGEEGPGMPCWKFERMFGGEYSGEELLGTVLQEQIQYYEGNQ